MSIIILGEEKKGSSKKKEPIEEESSEDEVYDSADDYDNLSGDENDDSADENDEDADEEDAQSSSGDEDDDEDDNEFEQQSSDDDEEDYSDSDDNSDEEGAADRAALEKSTRALESKARGFIDEDEKPKFRSRIEELKDDLESGRAQKQQLLHTDDLSSDDEEADGNTIGRVPLHWYDAFDHIGYDISGQKLLKRQV
jgi:ribosome biogenesis protein ERB1